MAMYRVDVAAFLGITAICFLSLPPPTAAQSFDHPAVSFLSQLEEEWRSQYSITLQDLEVSNEPAEACREVLSFLQLPGCLEEGTRGGNVSFQTSIMFYQSLVSNA